jgi:hypothetical protein
VARLRAEIKRGFLRSLWRTASAATIPLAECLAAFQDRGFQWIRDGRIIINTAGGGYSTGFQANEVIRELTPEEVFALSEEFFGVYTDAQTTLSAAGQDPNDDELAFATMMADDRLNASRVQMPDYTMLRWPSVASRG